MKIKYINSISEISEKWKPVSDAPDRIEIISNGKKYTVITREKTHLLHTSVKEFWVSFDNQSNPSPIEKKPLQPRVINNNNQLIPSHIIQGQNPAEKSHPQFFEELRADGYVHLYNHLIHMKTLRSRNERNVSIENMTFSSLSHVVLETRKAIIQKVEASIPAGERTILILVGNTGSGKSTASCFLQGNKMMLQNSNYISLNDKSGLISGDLADSCTFLPNIEITQNLVIIDFAGFHDSNGKVVSIGMECALKACIDRHHAQILVMESINEVEGKFFQAGELGLRLERLLENKKNCILGLTKYASNAYCIKIKGIEREQNNNKSLLKDQETAIIADIKLLSTINKPFLIPIIQEKQKQLADIQQKSMHLEIDPELEHYKNQLQNIENEFLNQIGLNRFIRFDDLEDSNRLSSCLTALTEPPIEKTRANPKHPLDYNHKDLLDRMFKKDLMTMIETQNWQVTRKDLTDFAQSIMKSSLIAAICSESNAEIGEFLHLPEIDPEIVRQYDKEIICSCFEKYCGSLVCMLDDVLSNQKLKVMSEEKTAGLNEQLNDLKDELLHVLILWHIDPKQREKNWNEACKKYKIKRYTLPAWARDHLDIPITIPVDISERTIDASCHELKKIKTAVRWLRDLKIYYN